MRASVQSSRGSKSLSARGGFHPAISKANLHGDLHTFSYNVLQMIAELFWVVCSWELSMPHQTERVISCLMSAECEYDSLKKGIVAESICGVCSSVARYVKFRCTRWKDLKFHYKHAFLQKITFDFRPGLLFFLSFRFTWFPLQNVWNSFDWPWYFLYFKKLKIFFFFKKKQHIASLWKMHSLLT